MSDAAEIKRRMEELQKTIVALTEAMKLRQWCVERAVQVVTVVFGPHPGAEFPLAVGSLALHDDTKFEGHKQTGVLSDSERYPSLGHLKAITEYIHRFVSEPADIAAERARKLAEAT